MRRETALGGRKKKGWSEGRRNSGCDRGRKVDAFGASVAEQLRSLLRHKQILEWVTGFWTQTLSDDGTDIAPTYQSHCCSRSLPVVTNSLSWSLSLQDPLDSSRSQTCLDRCKRQTALPIGLMMNMPSRSSQSSVQSCISFAKALTDPKQTLSTPKGRRIPPPLKDDDEENLARLSLTRTLGMSWKPHSPNQLRACTEMHGLDDGSRC